MAMSFGESIRLEIYGGSHEKEVGMRLEGIPAGLPVDREALQAFLDRRAPGRNAWSTARKEADRPEFRSGLQPAEEKEAGEETEGLPVTTGEPVEAVIPNTNIRPGDYDKTKTVPRPAHGDYPSWVRWGRIPSGGGRFSARMTAPMCIAGGIFLQWMEAQGILVRGHILSIGEVEEEAFPLKGEEMLTPPQVGRDFPVMDPARGEEMKEAIARVKGEGDSLGGIIECGIYGLPTGLGGPLFDGLEGRLSQAVFAVPAVKGIEFGSGFGAAGLLGSENNDPFILDGDRVRTKTNRHGGILGGMSSGMPLVFRVAMKPTPSIAKAQKSVDLQSMEEVELRIQGRHDPCIVPRAVPCIEAAAALALGDVLLEEGRLG